MTKNLLRIVWGLVAWAWLLSIALVLLELYDTIEFTQPWLGVVLRAIPWLLVYPASRYFGLSRWLGRTMWLGLLGTVVVGVVTFFAGGILLLAVPYFFFGGATNWHTTYVYSKQDNKLYVKQQDFRQNDTRTIVLLPVTPWLNIPLDSTKYAVQSWTPVRKNFAYFGPDSAEQGTEDRRAYHFRFCTRQKARLDSLERLHRLPTQVLPVATQQGAGTLGCVLGKQVWCVPLRPAPEPVNCSATWAEGWHGLDGATNFILRADRIYDTFFIDLPYPLPRQPGNWPATLCLGWSAQSDNSQPIDWLSAPQAAVATITRLDTVAHIIAGTFTGTMYRPYPKDRNKLKRPPYSQMERIEVSQGRFDLQYEPGLHYATP